MGQAQSSYFLSTKEHVVILHPLHGEGEIFKFLGTYIDPHMNMQFCIDSIISKIKPKIKALLRTKAHYDVAAMIGQFKTHVWSQMEFHNGAILHAAPSLLQRLDDIQRSFLHALQITAETAFLNYNFPLPSLRRDIGMMGLIQKRVLGIAHPAFSKLLPFTQHPAMMGHDKQVYDYLPECSFRRHLLHRSIFGLVSVYNLLQQYAVSYTHLTLQTKA